MFKITEYVKASTIWPTAKDYEDFGSNVNLLRGYNVEVRKADGTTYWHSCEWIDADDVEKYFNDEFHRFHYSDMGVVPTGRMCFRGYAIEKYDFEERDTYIETVDNPEKYFREESNR